MMIDRYGCLDMIYFLSKRTNSITRCCIYAGFLTEARGYGIMDSPETGARGMACYVILNGAGNFPKQFQTSNGQTLFWHRDGATDVKRAPRASVSIVRWQSGRSFCVSR